MRHAVSAVMRQNMKGICLAPYRIFFLDIYALVEVTKKGVSCGAACAEVLQGPLERTFWYGTPFGVFLATTSSKPFATSKQWLDMGPFILTATHVTRVKEVHAVSF